jgi:hypothetical protein
MRLIDSTKPNRKSGFVLGYFQLSLRDWYRHARMAGFVFGKSCPNEPIEKANLDKSDFQPSFGTGADTTRMVGLFLASAVQNRGWKQGPA